jgi:hypothetical protein
MTTIYTTSKWDNVKFLMALHDTVSSETIKFKSVDDGQHSRVYNLALFDSIQDHSNKLFVTPSNNNIFSNVNMVGGFDVNLLNAFQSKLPDFQSSFVDIDDIRETVSFSVFKTNIFHKLPGDLRFRMKKVGDEVME